MAGRIRRWLERFRWRRFTRIMNVKFGFKGKRKPPLNSLPDPNEPLAERLKPKPKWKRATKRRK